jgi:hypothetical protein
MKIIDGIHRDKEQTVRLVNSFYNVMEPLKLFQFLEEMSDDEILALLEKMVCI